MATAASTIVDGKAAALGDGSMVLGIDATWTVHQPSGVALLQLGDTGNVWELLPAISCLKSSLVAPLSGETPQEKQAVNGVIVGQVNPAPAQPGDPAL